MLTKRQSEVLTVINDGLKANGFPPSYQEIGASLGLKSKNSVHRLVTALEERGFIRRLPCRPRSIEVIRLQSSMHA